MAMDNPQFIVDFPSYKVPFLRDIPLLRVIPGGYLAVKTNRHPDGSQNMALVGGFNHLETY